MLQVYLTYLRVLISNALIFLAPKEKEPQKAVEFGNTLALYKQIVESKIVDEKNTDKRGISPEKQAVELAEACILVVCRTTHNHQISNYSLGCSLPNTTCKT